jgi:ribosome-binding protein aMBF1 (putative translation factor)
MAITMSNKKISVPGDREKPEQTPTKSEERTKKGARADLLDEIVNARQSCGMTQRRLGDASGVKQPVIARLERGTTDPQLSTIIKILAPLGKTLAVVSIDKDGGKRV